MSFNGSVKGTILVADDNASVREPLIELLRSHCYRVISAEDGDHAFTEVCSHPVDLVLLDVMMPGPTGFSVCRAIKARPETRFVPVVLITGLAGGEDRIRGIEAGADDFLNKPVKKEELLARVRSLVRLKRYTDELENAETVLCTLARSIEAKDPYTEGHCDRLSRYAVSLAEKIGLSPEVCIDLRRGGIVHDIGKVAVPEAILLKPGPLDPAERKLMENHTLAGERICAPLKSFRNVLPIIRSHHEKQNGTGYPDCLKGDEIPLTARVLQTVDIYDSLTTDRPYRKELSHEAALDLMWEETRRGWWDADLVGAVEGLLKESPLLLSTLST
ncbi:MAG TPA: HD domain-containing phosphohydrolase [Candidatus Acidoferrales bacterium]|nr:HD domain-containing phosphohydrolase [Candidatus Acidoferrales bacterium]